MKELAALLFHLWTVKRSTGRLSCSVEENRAFEITGIHCRNDPGLFPVLVRGWQEVVLGGVSVCVCLFVFFLPLWGPEFEIYYTCAGQQPMVRFGGSFDRRVQYERALGDSGNEEHQEIHVLLYLW